MTGLRKHPLAVGILVVLAYFLGGTRADTRRDDLIAAALKGDLRRVKALLHAKADVRYIHEGTAGFKFTHLSVETKGAIIQFIRQNQIRFAIKTA